jgi:hypothetical protein
MTDTGRFTRDDFSVDHDARTMTCPAGHTVAVTAANHAFFDWRCDNCPPGTVHHGQTRTALPPQRSRRRPRRSPPSLAQQRFHPGLPPLATDGRTQPRLDGESPTGASTATASGSPTEPPPSTSNGSSTSASTKRPLADHRMTKALGEMSKEGRLYGIKPPT